MKILTAEKMAYVDRVTIERGTPGLVLMRNAGKAVFDLIKNTTGSICGKAVVLAGKGNNGGDGFRVAELLAKSGWNVDAYLFGTKEDVRGDALTCMHDAKNAGLTTVEMTGENHLQQVHESIDSADVIIDALFGTGLKGDICGLAASVIPVVNDSDAIVFAVDIPSGVNASTGAVSASTVQADYTVTFGCFKVGHIFGPGRRKCGEITVADIGFDSEIMDSVECTGFALSKSEAAELIPRRAYNAHKGSEGRIFLLSGSVGLTGATTLSSMAAMRIGAGMVTTGCPSSLNDILEIKLTEVMTLPLAEVRKKRCLSLRALGMVRKAAEKAHVVAIGPGLGTYHETSELVRLFIAEYTGRVVLDADGINAFKSRPDLLSAAPCEIVLTPHIGELSRLMDKPVEELAKNPVESARLAAVQTGSVVLLKGAPTVITTPDEAVWVNPTGSEAMATAGMGDVLTGTIAGFAAQGLTLFEATKLGAYVHGRAGELAAEEFGIPSVMAGDVLEKLSYALIDTGKNI
ncbi:MAG: NAD(P)H-hydrate dehydratase [Candidatus Latescibacteria bacterium]|nr:NAD(P)H-hydrate dehydratase [Candidatus Latescibacterota bacterium]